ncbi:hypothetical protein DIPPA_70095 [Diplonema papillatum]|nr:hypothetical protein DIPPA_70095 [Diplonema papillatum]
MEARRRVQTAGTHGGHGRHSDAREVLVKREVGRKPPRMSPSREWLNTGRNCRALINSAQPTAFSDTEEVTDEACIRCQEMQPLPFSTQSNALQTLHPELSQPSRSTKPFGLELRTSKAYSAQYLCVSSSRCFHRCRE